MLGLGVAALLAVRERDLIRLRVPALAYAVFGALVLIALARFGDQVDWSRPAAWAMVGWLGVLLGLGAYGSAPGRAGRSTLR
jgi:hypothetical protein